MRQGKSLTALLGLYALFFVGWLLFGYREAMASKNLPCTRVSESELQEFWVPLETGRADPNGSLATRLLTTMRRCIAVNTQCVVSIAASDGDDASAEQVNIYTDRELSDRARFLKTGETVLGAWQVREASGREACLLAKRLPVHATPWYVKGWRWDEEGLETNENLSYYASYTQTSTPTELVESLEQSYKHWSQKITKRKKRTIIEIY